MKSFGSTRLIQAGIPCLPRELLENYQLWPLILIMISNRVGECDRSGNTFNFCKSYSASETNTVVHDFNGHKVNGIHGLNGKKCYDKALYLVNNRHDFKGMHDFKGNFPYDDFFRKTHARLYLGLTILSVFINKKDLQSYTDLPMKDFQQYPREITNALV